ncbi:peptidylprolyl isomerase [Komarekiella sp. 'clone 1']|uniref:peptidylprolyl isomerase n=1 Tax=Komarekiella delphini-convector SJRDD-AB1 TaxID=2593771 RepID=A0AA40SUU3_9NOST|nr:peptidylprolyl isomerase [Komarekiella delphini-convector]MBD6615683.1 peptidylprolyl isomerase [Komarekiella delphini-convector SJRDD-AB1]
MKDNSATISLPKVSTATDEKVIQYLRYSCKFAEFADLAERDALVLSVCEQFGITVSEDELQAAGDIFRQEYKLLDAAETFNWFDQQQIAVQDWSQGIQVALLTKKLKEHLFADDADFFYLHNRDSCKRVALSQILVRDLTTALKIIQQIKEDKAFFCSLALQHSQGKQSKESGGFVGVRFLAELLSELAQAIVNGKEGEVIGPIQTKLGYHILKIEKWFPSEFNEIKEQILEIMFQAWLNEKNGSNSETPIEKN